MSFHFRYGPAVTAGEGAIARLGETVDSLLPLRTQSPGDDRAVLLITDPGVRALGLADPAVTALDGAGYQVAIFDAVEADPSHETVLAAADAARDAALVIGFGGGSPMDVAKLAAYLAGSGDELDAIWGVGNAHGARLPLIQVPTTAGTGSEATAVSIVTVGGEEKRGVSSPALLADHAVLDPLPTLGLPQGVTAATGMDAMVHAIEAYTSARLKNPMSDMLAREAIRLLAANLPAVVARPDDVEARTAMLLGAHLAGVAFANAPVGGVHALAYPLGGRFHVPHGLSNTLMLPHVLSHNMASALPLYAELGPLVDPALAGEGQQGQARGLIEALEQLAVDSGLPRRLAQVGVGTDDLDRLAADAMLQQRLLINNPCPITEADARRLYEAAL